MSALSETGHIYDDLRAYEEPGLIARQSQREVNPSYVTIERHVVQGKHSELLLQLFDRVFTWPSFYNVSLMRCIATFLTASCKYEVICRCEATYEI